MADKIQFGINQKLDCFVYFPSRLTSSQIETIEGLKNIPKWSSADLSGASILADYTNNPNSSSSGQVAHSIKGYKVFRRKVNENFEEVVADIKLSQTAPQEKFTLNDYDVNSNTAYIYTIYPYSESNNDNGTEVFEIPYKVQDESEDRLESLPTDVIVAEWQGYSLVPLIETGKNQYKILNNPTEELPNWNFFVNYTEEQITQNQSKEIFTTFAKTPKIQSGKLNYVTGSISCNLGNVDCNGQYIEPTELIDKWSSFVEQNHICLLRNPKGDSIIISIDANTTRQYMNEISNWNINTDYQITSRPTKISFNFTEVKKKDEVEITTQFN